MAKKYLDDSGMSYFWGKLKDYFQAKLVSGTNIKTINNETLLGSGNISVTSTPTASTISEFDSSAHMNSTDMTSQEVSDFVDSLNPSAIEVESKTYTNMRALRSGNVVTIKIAGTASASTSGWYSLGTLDAQFRPSATVFGVCYNNDDNTWNVARPIMVQIGAGGSVSVWLQPDKLSLTPRGSITYVTAA